MKQTTINSKLIHQWIMSQPLMPRARYLVPLVKDLSLTHTAPEQDFQIMPRSFSAASPDELPEFSNQIIDLEEKYLITLPTEISQKTDAETITSDSPIIKSVTVPPIDEHIQSEKTDNIQIREPIISFDNDLRKTKKKKKSPAHPSKFLFPLIGGLVIVIFGIWIVYDNNPSKQDNDDKVQKLPTNTIRLEPDIYEPHQTITLPESLSHAKKNEENENNNQQSPQDFIREYYQDITENDVEAVVAKWKAPKRVEKLRSVIADVDWFKIQDISEDYLDFTQNNVQIYLDVITGKGNANSATQKTRWTGTIDLEKVDGNWKIIRLKLKPR